MRFLNSNYASQQDEDVSGWAFTRPDLDRNWYGFWWSFEGTFTLSDVV